MSPSWHTQADAATLFKDEVYPDIIGRHERSRARSEPGSVPTVNAIVAQKHGRAVREAFGADGAQLLRMSVLCVLFHICCQACSRGQQLVWEHVDAQASCAEHCVGGC